MYRIVCTKTGRCSFILQNVYSQRLLTCGDLLPRLADPSSCAVSKKHAEIPGASLYAHAEIPGASLYDHPVDPSFSVHVSVISPSALAHT